MASEPFHYHAYLGSQREVEESQRIAEELFGTPLAGSWKRVGSSSSAEFGVSSTGLSTVSVSLSVGEDPQTIVTVDQACLIDGTARESYLHLIMAASCRLGVVLGRTSASGLRSAVQLGELQGELEVLDWFQFLSAPLAGRWSEQVLRSAPLERLLKDPSGSLGIVLRGDPGRPVGRQAVADVLGVALRPVIGVNPTTGDPIVIPYD